MMLEGPRRVVCHHPRQETPRLASETNFLKWYHYQEAVLLVPLRWLPRIQCFARMNPSSIGSAEPHVGWVDTPVCRSFVGRA